MRIASALLSSSGFRVTWLRLNASVPPAKKSESVNFNQFFFFFLWTIELTDSPFNWYRFRTINFAMQLQLLAFDHRYIVRNFMDVYVGWKRKYNHFVCIYFGRTYHHNGLYSPITWISADRFSSGMLQV